MDRITIRAAVMTIDLGCPIVNNNPESVIDMGLV